MMNFEEFFLKKKINLKSLANLKPDLFLEFKTHYAQMGEKSFDHTKKYWFNFLRKDFRLSDKDELELKESLNPVKSQIQEVSNIGITSELILNPVEGFKPRFKATTVLPKLVEKIEEPLIKEKPNEEIAKLIGFKPRFKASSVAVKQEEKIEKPLINEKPVGEIAKPIGFKPRFKAGIAPIKNSDD